MKKSLSLVNAIPSLSEENLALKSEIQSIKAAVNKQQSILDSLLSHIPTASSHVSTSSGPSGDCPASYSQAVQRNVNCDTSHQVSPTLHAPAHIDQSHSTKPKSKHGVKSKQGQSQHSPQDRKFNIIIQGIKECPHNKSHRERILIDEEAATGVLKHISPSFNEWSIRECIRLGKYSQDNARPRLLLVKLNKVSDVLEVLSKRSSSPSKYYIYQARSFPL